MKLSDSDKSALKAGKTCANDIIAFRNKELKNRKKTIKKSPGAFRFRTQLHDGTPSNEKFEAAFSFSDVATEAVLIAEGDSWFDYPLHDVLRFLEDDHGYEVESVAHKGDTVESMAYELGQLEELTRLIEKILRRGVTPRAILLSGGGNDIAGPQFSLVLNHAKSGLPYLNEQVVTGVIEGRTRSAYITMLNAITSICKERTGSTIPILIHGYDYPVPDGRGFLGGFSVLPGPWMEPGFREKGYHDLKLCTSIVMELMERFNVMLEEVSSLSPFAEHVKYVNLRQTLSNDLNQDNYKKWWGNELHPTKKGFKKVTNQFTKVLNSI